MTGRAHTWTFGHGRGDGQQENKKQKVAERPRCGFVWRLAMWQQRSKKYPRVQTVLHLLELRARSELQAKYQTQFLEGRLIPVEITRLFCFTVGFLGLKSSYLNTLVSLFVKFI